MERLKLRSKEPVVLELRERRRYRGSWVEKVDVV